MSIASFLSYLAAQTNTLHLLLKHKPCQSSNMQTSLLHELFIGNPIISAACDQLQKSVNRYLPDPATQCQYSTKTSKQSKTFLPFIHKLGRKADSLSQGVQEHGEYYFKPVTVEMLLMKTMIFLRWHAIVKKLFIIYFYRKNLFNSFCLVFI